MNENGKQTPLTVGSGPPPRYFGIPEEPWEDGALYVLRVDGRSAWLEKCSDNATPHNVRRAVPYRERFPTEEDGKSLDRPTNRTSTADFEPHGNS